MKPLRQNFIVCIVLLSSSSFCFFFVNFMMKNLNGSIIKNTIFSQSAEIVARALGGVIYMKVGARLSLSSMFMISTIGSIFLIIFYDREDLLPYFIIFTKFGVAAVINMLLIASVMLFPTQFTAAVFGYCNMIGRLFTVMSSLVAELDEPLNLMIFAVVACIGIIFSFFLLTKLPRFI